VTPSVVRLDKQARVTVGTRARRFVEQDPANTAAEFKRLMGTGKAIEFPAANVTRKPEELSAEILKALRQDITDQLGVTIERAVISVPALRAAAERGDVGGGAAGWVSARRAATGADRVGAGGGLAGGRRRRRDVAGVRFRRRHVRRVAARDARRVVARGRPRRRQLPRRARLRLGDHGAPRVATVGGAEAE
jgi:hypothetical protein